MIFFERERKKVEFYLFFLHTQSAFFSLSFLSLFCVFLKNHFVCFSLAAQGRRSKTTTSISVKEGARISSVAKSSEMKSLRL